MFDIIQKKIAAARYLLAPYKMSYSQCAEDLLLAQACKALGITKPFYVDIGANDPVLLSNTYLFYRQGCRGICVEPNPVLCAKIRSKRPYDIAIEAGMGASLGSADYYMFDKHVLNTFSKIEAAESVKMGYPIKRTAVAELIDFSSIVEKYKIDRIDILSLDIEGLDLDILKTIDYEAVRPKLICVETKKFTDRVGDMSGSETAAFLKGKGYALLCSTLLNTIFVDSHEQKS